MLFRMLLIPDSRLACVSIANCPSTSPAWMVKSTSAFCRLSSSVTSTKPTAVLTGTLRDRDVDRNINYNENFPWRIHNI